MHNRGELTAQYVVTDTDGVLIEGLLTVRFATVDPMTPKQIEAFGRIVEAVEQSGLVREMP